MSHAMNLLKLLHERGPLSAAQLAEASGLSRKQVLDALHSLRTRKAMQMGDRPYQITAAGCDLAEKREARAKRQAEKEERPKPPRPPKPPMPLKSKAPKAQITDMPIIRRIVAASVQSDSIVHAAVQSRPALQSAWGAMHV